MKVQRLFEAYFKFKISIAKGLITILILALSNTEFILVLSKFCGTYLFSELFFFFFKKETVLQVLPRTDLLSLYKNSKMKISKILKRAIPTLPIFGILKVIPSSQVQHLLIQTLSHISFCLVFPRL